MNKRIRQLKEQARDFYLLQEDLDCSTKQLHELVDTKFAELIVKECIEQASIGNGHGNNQWDRALTFASKNINDHFGVK